MIRVNGETIFVKDYRSRRGDRHEMDSGTTERIRAEWGALRRTPFRRGRSRTFERRPPEDLERDGPVNLKEGNSNSIRSAIAPHHSSELFRRLSQHPRIIEPAMQTLGGPVYLHQFKINTKNAHDGEIWHWHQDYRTWFEDDGMPEPRVINAALFLDDVTEFNGPTMFVPGTHKLGDRIPEYGRLAEDAIDSPYTNETIDRLIKTRPRVPPAEILVAPTIKSPPRPAQIF